MTDEKTLTAAAEEENANLEGKMYDAETFLRTAWDLLDDLADAKKVPREFVAKVEALHDELVELLPDDEDDEDDEDDGDADEKND